MSTLTVIVVAVVAAWLAVVAAVAAVCRAAARADNAMDAALREDRAVADLERAWELHLPARVLIDRFTQS